MPRIVHCFLLAAALAACGGESEGEGSDIRRGSTEEFCEDFGAARDVLNFQPRTAGDFGLIREGLLGLRYPEEIVPLAEAVISAMVRLENELEGVDLSTPEGEAALDALIAQPDVGDAMVSSAAISQFANVNCEAPAP